MGTFILTMVSTSNLGIQKSSVPLFSVWDFGFGWFGFGFGFLRGEGGEEGGCSSFLSLKIHGVLNNGN